jgi:hypothetical protein
MTKYARQMLFWVVSRAIPFTEMVNDSACVALFSDQFLSDYLLVPHYSLLRI